MKKTLFLLIAAVFMVAVALPGCCRKAAESFEESLMESLEEMTDSLEEAMEEISDSLGEAVEDIEEGMEEMTPSGDDGEKPPREKIK